jgi:hypothetical protein
MPFVGTTTAFFRFRQHFAAKEQHPSAILSATVYVDQHSSTIKQHSSVVEWHPTIMRNIRQSYQHIALKQHILAFKKHSSPSENHPSA